MADIPLISTLPGTTNAPTAAATSLNPAITLLNTLNGTTIPGINTSIAANSAIVSSATIGNTALGALVNSGTVGNTALSVALTAANANIATLAAAAAADLLLASGSTAAGANTTLIQTALTAGGIVNISQPGVFYTNATLIHGSNTIFILGPNTTLQLAPNSNCTMLLSSSAVAYLAGGTAVTLTQGANNAVNVLWTAHGLTLGQAVWLGGSTPSAYNGVFLISAVVDANNFTIYTKTYATAAPTGSAFAVVALQNFALVGGTWNKDYLNQPSNTGTYQAHTINLAGLLDCMVSDVTAINSNKSCFCVCAVEGFRWWNLRANGPAFDGMKIYGPSRTMVGDGMIGYANVDFISLQTREPPATIAWQISGGGDIFDVTVKNINADAGTSTFTIYPSDLEITDSVVFDQVAGMKAGAFIGNISNATFTNNLIGQVTLRNLSVMHGTSTRYCTMDQLIVTDSSYNPYITTSAGNPVFFSVGTGSVFNSIIFERIKSNGVPSTAGNINLVFFGAGTIGRVVARDCVIDGAIGTLNLLTFNGVGSVAEILIDGGYFDSTSKYLVNFASAPGSGTPNITLRNTFFTGTGGAVLGGAMSARVRLEGNTFNNVSLGVVRVNVTGSPTLVVQSDGCNAFLATSPVLALVGGTPAITAYGPDLKVDAGLLATTQGQHFYHSSAVGGRNAANQQGLCIGVDGTHFYAMGTGTGGVNTLIV